jgi:hypothetical protein
MPTHESPARLSDGSRSVSAPTASLANRLMTFCQNNSVTDNAGLSTVLNGLTQANMNQVLIALVLGLTDVGPPNT